MDTIALILPTYNAEKDLYNFLPALSNQTLQPILFAIDSSSTDNTRRMLEAAGFIIHQISKHQFNHGGTRQLATQLIDADIYIFMTQDAILASESTLQDLIAGLKSKEDIACAYGRQLPKFDANALSMHGRFANYSDTSYVRYLTDKKQYGIKTCFNSNNLAAYKKEALNKIGGFPKNIITAEDAYVAAKFLLTGFGIHYAANATIYHSHNLTFLQEFHRYFSIGVFHAKDDWIIKEFNTATKEGWNYVISEINFLRNEKKLYLLPKAILSTLVKFIAYKCGLHSHLIPHFLKKRWGINKNYWIQNYS